MYQAYAADPQMRLNVGIRRRLAPLMENSRRRDRAAERAALLACRARPSSTTATRSGWATTSISAIATASARRCSGPATGTAASRGPTRRGSTRRSSWTRCTATRRSTSRRRSATPFSLLNWMKRMIALRKQHHGVRARRRSSSSPCSNRKVLAYVRRDRRRHGPRASRTCRARVQPVELDLSALQGHDAGRDARPDRVPADRRAPVLPDARRRTRSTGSACSRRPAAITDPARAGDARRRARTRPRCSSARRGTRCSMATCDAHRARPLLPFLQRQRWFGGKGTAARGARFVDWGLLRAAPTRCS